ncbi:MAG: phosphate ABC transporter, permease protein PstA [Omnitrophica bacterium GWA2_52_8]|nr:MAG: phosphate ABC transporter, permease protein PstA [Omnitrophica bacterium GWA2_52_8]
MKQPPLLKPEVRKYRPPGESFVWFTATGLSLGLVMILFLLGIIFVKGVDVFWPKKAALIELKPDSPAQIGPERFLAGVVTTVQEKIGGDSAALAESQKEWQLFVGNKDVYGYGFKYFDAAFIQKVSYPESLARIERLEYGDAFGYPVMIKLAAGQIRTAGQPGFIGELKRLVHESEKRWDKIRDIEKRQIGKINDRLEDLRLKEKSRTSQHGLEARSHRELIAQEAAGLQGQYQLLAQKAQELRKLQKQDLIVYRLASGEEKELPAGQVLGFYFPNQLNWAGRAGLFCKRVFQYLSDAPREANTEGGVFPAIFGTLVMTVLMSLAVTPFGVLAAIYLREYAKQGFFVRAVRIAVNNLAGVPSIVFGVFGLGFFVYFVGGSIDRLFFKEALPTPTFGTGGILWASLTLALLTVPMVIVATEEALAAVPRGMREGSLACGASKWQTIQRIVLPASAPGILTGLILAMARGASEVAPLMLVGVVKLAPTLPLDGTFPFFHLERKFMHLGFHIYDLGFQSPDSEAAKPMVFATTLLLIGLVVVLNLGAIIIRENLRKKYSTGAF